jgi:hypothetical protein
LLLELFVTFGHLGPDPLQALGRVKKREGGLRDVPDLTIVNILTHLFSRYQLPLTNLFFPFLCLPKAVLPEPICKFFVVVHILFILLKGSST